MEPIPVFDNPGALAATWSQTEESVSITVPLPSGGARPEVVIRQQHLTVRWRPGSACEEGDITGSDDAPGSAEAAPAEESTEAAGAEDVRILLDNALSGDVTVEESAWTANDGMLIIELSKRPDYAGGAAGGAPPRCPWWPCAVRGGKKGPEDPKAPPKQEPNIHRLDSKIGAQAESKKSFQGKSKFQW
mmetsp:Transcript_34140/g.98301  ORF Transcript_34140/g.98301 Transcript_34140/m.98301 type:complete len:189 (-) Transcript_34140:55-621(-)